MILKEDLVPRGRWKLGRIEELIEGSVDGVHRAAVIRTSSGRKLNRPYRMIYPLELTGTVDKSTPQPNCVDDIDSGPTYTTEGLERRSTRAAAQAARGKIATYLRASESDFDE